MKKIDLSTWERKSHYAWFSQFADPSIAIDAKMNITNVIEFSKKRGVSSYAIIMYTICMCMNQNKAFRLRILNDEVLEIGLANVAYTIMVNDSCFVNCRANLKQGFEVYLSEVKENQIKYSNSNYIQEEYNSVAIIDDIYCSCLPWLNFSSIKQPIPDKIPESKAIPRACWGRYYTEFDCTYMTLNITANHALVDGLDMANVFNNIQKAFDDIENFVKV